MNWLYFFIVCFSGLLSGFLTWLATPSVYPWHFTGGYQAVMISTGLLCGFFVAFASSMPVLVTEKRFAKSLRYWVSGASTGLSVSMVGSVAFTIAVNIANACNLLQPGIIQFCWWIYLSVLLAGCFGIVHSSLQIMCRAVMGLTPAMLIAGTFIDRFLKEPDEQLASYLLLGTLSAFGFAIAWDLLKTCWLDEEISSYISFRYYIDDPEFLIGSGNACDLSLPYGDEHICAIVEKDGIHAVEAMNQSSCRINNGNFKYRVLVDGDTIDIGGRVFVYHTKLGRTRDELPAAV